MRQRHELVRILTDAEMSNVDIVAQLREEMRAEFTRATGGKVSKVMWVVRIEGEDDEEEAPDHPFLPQFMQARPHLCEECGEPRAVHSTEYDWKNRGGLNPFVMPPIIPIVQP